MNLNRSSLQPLECKSVYVRRATRSGNVMVLPWVNVCTLSSGEDAVNVCCPYQSSESSSSSSEGV